jgi:methylated-DNA-[protein]-cysteine S-methyltransferase
MIEFYHSPIGNIRIDFSEQGLAGLVFKDLKETPSRYSEMESRPGQMESQEIEMESHITTQLDQYFSGKRTAFDLPLDIRGTDFQKKVWIELLKIPYAKTISYKDLSLKVGNLKAIRAVGAANGANPISIIIPCHRVIGSDGSLTGYAGGLWRKQWLLELESGLRRMF